MENCGLSVSIVINGTLTELIRTSEEIKNTSKTLDGNLYIDFRVASSFQEIENLNVFKLDIDKSQNYEEEEDQNFYLKDSICRSICNIVANSSNIKESLEKNFLMREEDLYPNLLDVFVNISD